MYSPAQCWCSARPMRGTSSCRNPWRRRSAAARLFVSIAARVRRPVFRVKFYLTESGVKVVYSHGRRKAAIRRNVSRNASWWG
jgi:hypothetical protein